jgi:hypothetical protein
MLCCGVRVRLLAHGLTANFFWQSKQIPPLRIATGRAQSMHFLAASAIS